VSESEKQQPLETLLANRRAKLDGLREMNVDPYPGRFRVDSSVAEIRDRYDEVTAENLDDQRPSVRLAGRIRALRGHGKVSFADLSDGESQIQLYIRRDVLQEDQWQAFKLTDLGDVVGIDGSVFRTRAG
jgi:lysyl-tRNA synthetase class 2